MAEPQTFSDVLNNMRANLEAKKAAITPAPTEVSAGPVESAAKAPRAPRMTEFGRTSIRAFQKENPQLSGMMTGYDPGKGATRGDFTSEAFGRYIEQHPYTQQMYGGAQSTPSSGATSIPFSDIYQPREKYGPPEMQGPKFDRIGPPMPEGQRYASPIGPRAPIDVTSSPRWDALRRILGPQIPVMGGRGTSMDVSSNPDWSRMNRSLEIDLKALHPDIANMVRDVAGMYSPSESRPVGATPLMQSAVQGQPLPAAGEPVRPAPAMRTLAQGVGPRVQAPGYSGMGWSAPTATEVPGLGPQSATPDMTTRYAQSIGPQPKPYGASMGGQMGKGYVPKGFWEGATERVFQPEPGPPQGINLNDRDFRAARGLAGILSGMRSGRGLGVASGIGTLAGIGKEIWDERNARLTEQARPYTLDTPRIGDAQRTIAEDMARRTGPEAPFLSSVPGAPITFPTATAAAGAPSVAGRVTPGTGRPGATSGQQRGELDLTGMSFKDAFAFARNQAEAEGVDATGRFLWRGNAYQTNVGPARGRERYVPESQQTRLGNLPQLADAIAPTPQPAPAGERITEVLPRSAPVTPAAPTMAAQPQDVRENQIRIGQQTYPLSFLQENRGALAQLLGAQATQSRQNVEPIEVVPAQRGVATSYDDIRQRRTQQLLRNPEKGYFSDNPNYQLAWQTLWSPAVRAQFGVTDEQMNELKNTMRESTKSGESTTGGSKMTVNKRGVFVLPSTSSTESSESSSSRESETGSRTQTKKDYSAWVKELNDLIEKDANWARDAEKAEREAIKESAERKKTTLEVQGKERSEKNASRLQEITTDLRGLEADPRAKTEFAPLIRQLRREQQDLTDLLGKD